MGFGFAASMAMTRVVGASHIKEVQWDMRMGFIGGVLDWLDW